MRYHFLLAAVLVLIPAAAIAQSDIDVDTVVSVDFSDEGLTDEDLSADLEAEALPTTNGLTFRWEQIRDNIASVFIFNAERKAIHYRQRLHRLDRKSAACAEIGDEECIDRINKRTAALQVRAGEHIARQQELQGDLQDRFDRWRQRREAKIDEHRVKAAARREQRQELQEQRRARRSQARDNRQQVRQERRDALRQGVDQRRTIREDQRQELQNDRQEIRELRQDTSQERRDQRQDNREQLIELRSENVKDRLDETRSRVQLRQDANE